MVFVKLREGEGIEDAVRRFKRECERNGVLKEIRRRRHYMPPSLKKKLQIQEPRGKRRRNGPARSVERNGASPHVAGLFPDDPAQDRHSGHRA